MTDNKKEILVVVSHPRADSLTHSLKDAVIKGILQSGARVTVQDLYKQKFDPVLYDLEANSRDPVTLQLQENLARADGVIFVTPLWWANVPAMLKGYFDRLFTEGFSFKYNQAGIPVGLLENKKALLIGTCDTLLPIAYISGTVLGFKSVIKGILKFSGIKDSRFKLFGSVIKSTAKKRQQWLTKAEAMGRKFAAPEGAMSRFKQTFFSYIKAVRLPLYSFVFSLILLGSAIGASITKEFKWSGLVLALAIGLAGHAAVSLSNEAADEAADRVNANRTMFNGGTGLLQKGQISLRQLNTGWIVSSILALGIPAVLVFQFHFHWLLLAASAVALFLGVQYSLPPCRFSRKGLGEIASFIAYGIPMMIIGFVLEADQAVVNRVVTGFRFLLISLPVSIAVFVTLCLTQIPDTDADRSVGKRSVSVLLGPGNVLALSLIMLVLCVITFISFIPLGILPVTYSLAACIFPLTTVIVIAFNRQAFKVPAGMTMINIMGLSVTSAVFSGIIPAIYFFSHSVGMDLLR